MDKVEFLNSLKAFRKEISDLEKLCQKAPGRQVQSKALLDSLETLATRWFDEIDQPLHFIYQIDESTLNFYREQFGRLLELSDSKPSKALVIDSLRKIQETLHSNILVSIQKYQKGLDKFPKLDAMLSHTKGLEEDFLREAVDCARLNKNRAAIILGWCAAISHLQLHVEKKGFDKFSQASAQMCAIQSGRYKRFNKKFEIQNLSDLRMTVFDNDLLWVLEFMGGLDGNQHERLEVCFTMRNTCAHPGETMISDENLLSFFSDLDTIIFTNPNLGQA